MTAQTGQSILISKETVDAAAPADRPCVLWDRKLKGFSVRIEPSGAKSRIDRYRIGGARRGLLRQFKVGRGGKLAAEQAQAAHSDLSAVADPATEIRAGGAGTAFRARPAGVGLIPRSPAMRPAVAAWRERAALREPSA